MIKKCSQCIQLLEITQFYKYKPAKDGYNACCKICYRERIRNFRKARPSLSNIYDKKRKTQDIQFKLSKNIRSRLSGSLKNQVKSGSSILDLGCTITELKQYLESKFQPGMSWENYGVHGWHLDHIKPLSKFDLTQRDEFLKACHYTNLQPLWAKENWSKGNNT